MDGELETAEEHDYHKFSAPFQRAFDLCPFLQHIDVIRRHPARKITRVIRPAPMKDDGSVKTPKLVYLTYVREWMHLG